jgi:hypothetical protein
MMFQPQHLVPADRIGSSPAGACRSPEGALEVALGRIGAAGSRHPLRSLDRCRGATVSPWAGQTFLAHGASTVYKELL